MRFGVLNCHRHLIPSLVREGEWPTNFHCLSTMAKLLENRANPPSQEEPMSYDLANLVSRYYPEVGQGNPATWLQPLFQKLLAQVVAADLAQVWRLEQRVLPVVHRMKAVGIGVDQHRLGPGPSNLQRVKEENSVTVGPDNRQ